MKKLLKFTTLFITTFLITYSISSPKPMQVPYTAKVHYTYETIPDNTIYQYERVERIKNIEAIKNQNNTPSELPSETLITPEIIEGPELVSINNISKMIYKNKTFDIGMFTGDMMDKESVELTQNEVDSGHIPVTINDLDNFDNKLSYLTGHNPGVFDYIYKNFQNGDIVTIYDRYGSKQDYQMYKYYSAHYDNFSFPLYDKFEEEGIAIQYCVAPNKVMILYGNPVHIE